MNRYKCVCCNQYTLEQCPPGTYQVCSVCNWEDDKFQFFNPNFEGGANILSLNQAKKKYNDGISMNEEITGENKLDSEI